MKKACDSEGNNSWGHNVRGNKLGDSVLNKIKIRSSKYLRYVATAILMMVGPIKAHAAPTHLLDGNLAYCEITLTGSWIETISAPGCHGSSYHISQAGEATSHRIWRLVEDEQMCDAWCDYYQKQESFAVPQMRKLRGVTTPPPRHMYIETVECIYGYGEDRHDLLKSLTGMHQDNIQRPPAGSDCTN